MEATGGRGREVGFGTASFTVADPVVEAAAEDLVLVSARSLLKAEERLGFRCLRREEEDED